MDLLDIDLSFVPDSWYVHKGEGEGASYLTFSCNEGDGLKVLRVVQDGNVSFFYSSLEDGVRLDWELSVPYLEEPVIREYIGRVVGGSSFLKESGESGFVPRYAHLPADILLSSSVDILERSDSPIVVTFHPSLKYSWVIGDRYRSGYDTEEEAFRAGEKARHDRSKLSQVELGDVPRSDILDGMVQYLAFLDTRGREDRDVAFVSRVRDIYRALKVVGSRLGKESYQWTPIPIWNVSHSVIREAVLQHRTLRIRYTNEGDEETNVRLVEPHYVFNARTTGNQCLLSWCRLRDNWRCFIVPRINVLRIGEVFSFEERKVRSQLMEGIRKVAELAYRGPLDISVLEELSPVGAGEK